jgi:nitrite reductase/ring-hydroxylating ferredoxin subunit
MDNLVTAILFIYLKPMFSMKIKWVRFAEDEAALTQLLKSKKCSPLKVNAKAVLLVEHNGNYHMVKNRCPHQGITLENASCEDGKIVCPWHHYGFDLENGRGAGLYLDIYPIEKREDGYYAGFEYFSFF